MKRKKLIVVLLILLTLVVFLVIYFVQPKNNNQPTFEALSGNNALGNTLLGCREGLENELTGIWKYPGGEIQYITILDLENNGTFSLSATENIIDTVTGEWSYHTNEALLTLNFEKSQSGWLEVLKQDLSIYDSVKSYSYEDRKLELFIGYFPNPNEAEFNKCKSDRFYINLFNVYLYKIEEQST
ncbi:MAG TPA: hypothetical protein ENI23_12520 [bacterium]|nr:hypothetical protein [bacterium]